MAGEAASVSRRPTQVERVGRPGLRRHLEDARRGGRRVRHHRHAASLPRALHPRLPSTAACMCWCEKPVTILGLRRPQGRRERQGEEPVRRRGLPVRRLRAFAGAQGSHLQRRPRRTGRDRRRDGVEADGRVLPALRLGRQALLRRAALLGRRADEPGRAPAQLQRCRWAPRAPRARRAAAPAGRDVPRP